jgi:hypothetical protein
MTMDSGILTNSDGTVAAVTVSNAAQFTVGQFYDFYPNKDRPESDGAPSPSAVWTPTVTGILPLWEPRPGGPYELSARDLTTNVLRFATNLHESISNTSTRAPDQPAGDPDGRAAAAGSTIPPGTFVTMTMTTVDGGKSFPADSDVYLFLGEGGTATLPAGKVVIFGRYV